MNDPLLAELRERFRETSRARVAEMRLLLDSMSRGGADRDAVRRLSRHFHALAGLGATYGFPLVSELADEAEGSIMPFARCVEQPPESEIARWAEVTAQIEHDLDEEGGDLEIDVSRTAVSPRRILAIDDDATQAVLIRHVLETAGYQVAVCSDPDRFDETLAAFGPDLLLADVQLADNVSGHDLVRRAREDARFHSLAVIFVTGERDRRASVGRTSEGDPLVAKPVDWDVLLDLIASRLR